MLRRISRHITSRRAIHGAGPGGAERFRQLSSPKQVAGLEEGMERFRRRCRSGGVAFRRWKLGRPFFPAGVVPPNNRAVHSGASPALARKPCRAGNRQVNCGTDLAVRQPRGGRGPGSSCCGDRRPRRAGDSSGVDWMVTDHVLGLEDVDASPPGFGLAGRMCVPPGQGNGGPPAPPAPPGEFSRGVSVTLEAGEKKRLQAWPYLLRESDRVAVPAAAGPPERHQFLFWLT